jgi:hypothetical protein
LVVFQSNILKNLSRRQRYEKRSWKKRLRFSFHFGHRLAGHM